MGDAEWLVTTCHLSQTDGNSKVEGHRGLQFRTYIRLTRLQEGAGM